MGLDSSRQKRRQGRHLSIEPLEARQLLSAPGLNLVAGSTNLTHQGHGPPDFSTLASAEFRQNTPIRPAQAWLSPHAMGPHVELRTSPAITNFDLEAFQTELDLAGAPILSEASLTVPALSSNPSAAAKLYLDFDGHFEASWGAYSNITTPAFSLDSDLTTFSSGELAAINTIWARAAEDYAPFDIDITTVEPASFADREGMRVAIGGNNSWYGSGGGVAYVGTWTNFVVNTVYVFPQNLANNSKYIAEASSHEAGHGFGLYHQSRYDSGGAKTEEYHSGDGDWAPIMGLGYYKTRTTWHNGTSTSATTYQDDMAILSSTNNAFGYRTDDHGDQSAPTALVFSGSTATATGIIETMDDQDAFAFSTTGGTYTFTQDVAATGANLDSTLELRTAGGSLVASAAPTDSYGATITEGLVGGDYVLITASAGQYGSVGQYTVTATMDSGEINHAPVATDATFSLDENSASGTVVGTVTATDEDEPPQTLSYAITAGNSAGVFAINGASGQITVADGSLLNYENASQHVLTVRVTDDGTPNFSDTATITVDITDLNDAPALADASFSIADNMPNGWVVGTVTATDEDSPPQTLSYAITAGDSDGVFAIDSSSGQISVADNSSLDHLAVPQYTLTVEVNDDGSPAGSDTATITVDVTDINHAPILANTSLSLAENTSNGTDVDTVTASDEDDPPQTLTYAITAGNDAGMFAIDSSTGQITVANDLLLDFESASQHVLTVEVTDDGTPPLSDTAAITVNLTDVNEAPQVSDAVFSVAEGATAGTAVGTLTASDQDLPAQTLGYAITGGNSAGVFAINSTTGQITVADGVPLDYETSSRYTLSGEVTDDGSPALSGTATITVNIIDQNDAPQASDAVFSLAEDAASGTVIGTVTAVDEDNPTQALSYAITGGDSAGTFAVDGSTGQITVADDSMLDFETTAQYILSVHVSDNGSPNLSDTATVTVNVSDVNDAPRLQNETFVVHEDVPNGTVVGTVMGTDEDSPAQALSYAITAGNQAGPFAIDSATGEITVVRANKLRASVTPQYNLTVQATDNGTPSLSSNATITVHITDATVLSLTLSVAPAEVSEGLGPAAAMGTITRNASDLSSELVVTLVNGDPGEMTTPSTVTIPAGHASTKFSVDTVDDTFVDGTQAVSVIASASSYVSASTTIDVSDDEDVIEVVIGPTEIVVIHGTTDTYDLTLFPEIIIDGGSGIDAITVTGIGDNGTATLAGGRLDVIGLNYEIHVTSFEQVTAEALAGSNAQVTLIGSHGSNRIYSYADYSFLSDSPRTFSYRVEGFGSVTVDAPAGGRNYAFLYDSPGDDHLDADPSGATLDRADGWADTTATGFKRLYAYATAGGTDTAALTGSSAHANRFYGYAQYSILTESSRSFYYYAQGFDTVAADSPSTGNTYAYLYDSPGDDQLAANPGSATMTRAAGWPLTTATGFARVYAYSTRGGDDTAELTGSSSGNRFRGYPTYSTLTDTARSFYHYARGFHSVTAIGSSTYPSGDRAYLYDSDWGDTLYGATDHAYLEDVAGTYHNEVRYFDFVYARSSDDETTGDTAEIEDNLLYELIRSGSW